MKWLLICFYCFYEKQQWDWSKSSKHNVIKAQESNLKSSDRLPKMNRNRLSHWKSVSALTIVEKRKLSKGNSVTLWGQDSTFTPFISYLPFSLFHFNYLHFSLYLSLSSPTSSCVCVCVCVCVCAGACVCVCACVRVRPYSRVRSHVHVTLQWRVSHVDVWKSCCDLWTTGWPARSCQTVGHLVWAEISQAGCKTARVCLRLCEWETRRAASKTTRTGHLCKESDGSFGSHAQGGGGGWWWWWKLGKYDTTMETMQLFSVNSKRLTTWTYKCRSVADICCWYEAVSWHTTAGLLNCTVANQPQSFLHLLPDSADFPQMVILKYVFLRFSQVIV